MPIKRLWQHITKKRKSHIGFIVILMLMTSVAEVVSLGAVVPFLGVLANPESVFQHQYSQQFVHFIGVTEANQLLLPFTLIFAIAALFAGIMRIALLWGQTRLAHAIGADMSIQIYRRTLYQPYSVHVVRNSSEVIAGVSAKADQVVGATILPLLMLVSSLLMLVMVLGTLVLINPLMAISAIVGFITIYSLFIWMTKQRLLINSRRISDNVNLTIKVLQEGLGGIRDVLIDGTQEVYCKSFHSADLSKRRAVATNQIIGQSPRYGVESLGMVLIASLAYYLGSQQGGLIGALPILGALAIGAQRMLPMLQQAYAAWTSIRGSRAILEDSLVLLEQPMPLHSEMLANKKLVFQDSIVLEKVNFRYTDNAPKVLKQIDLVIPKGSRVGFIGTTGSGKSTLLDIIMSLLQPSDGKLMVDGTVITEKNHRSWQTHIAHIPQMIYLSDSTIAENIAFGLPKDKINLERVRQASQQAQISETIQNLDKQYETMVGERGVRLSGGQRQRIGIARALYKQADVIIFDEATSSLDNKTERTVMDAVDEINDEITILMVAHRTTTLDNCELIVELENGMVKRMGSYSEIIGNRAE